MILLTEACFEDPAKQASVFDMVEEFNESLLDYSWATLESIYKIQLISFNLILF
jgi:hypothetical protein